MPKSQLSRLEDKIDLMSEVAHDTNREVAAMAVKIQVIKKEVEETNGRVTRNERWRYILTGGGLVLLAVITYVGNVIVKLLPGG